MKLAKIYKRDVSGGTRVWWAETDDTACWRTHSGTLHGEIVTSEWRHAPPKSQSSSAAQALFEAQAAMDKKLRTDYKRTLINIDEARNSIIKPMLAHTYDGWERQCFAQPKLDGMRCLATPDGLWSRNNLPIISAPHIEAHLSEFFKQNPNIILDGELYNHEFHDNFNSIMSLAKKIKPTQKDLELSEQYLQYHIYDLYDQDFKADVYSTRLKRLDDINDNMPYFFGKTLIQVETSMIISEEDLEHHYLKVLQDGYEGQIIRYDREYQQKRSNYLLKRKEFVDEEFELLDIEEGAGNWEGLAKRAVCLSKEGIKFGAGISGTQEFCAKLLKEKGRYVSVTVKYHALTPDGVPRFPIAIKFYDKQFAGLEERTQPKRDLF
jgi:DNA ligase-1